MNLKAYGDVPDDTKAADDFARQLHDSWGVGHATEVGGTGVLLFLSVEDRIIYVSRRGAVEKLLTDARVDTVISEVTSSLKQTKYADGLLVALDMLAEFMAKDEPTWKEWLFGLFTTRNLLFVCELGLSIAKFILSLRRIRASRQAEREYALAASQLSEMDRQQAEAMQGQYEAKSCPICLEDFKSSTVGSDDKPIKLLRCGHVFDESCWSEWVNSGSGNVATCPICKRNVGAPTSTSNSGETASFIHVDDDQNRALQRYQQERNFRLLRMNSRFPNYVTQNQLNRWTSPAHSESLVQDPSFVQNDPQRSSSGGRRSGSYGGGFGGGFSSSGRGGRF